MAACGLSLEGAGFVVPAFRPCARWRETGGPVTGRGHARRGRKAGTAPNAITCKAPRG